MKWLQKVSRCSGEPIFMHAAFFFGPMNFSAMPRHEGHEARPLEAIVVRRQPPVILGHADGDQLADIDVGAQLLRRR